MTPANETPPLSAFRLNTDHLVRLMSLVDAQIDTTNKTLLPELKERLTAAQNDLYAKGAVFGEYLSFKFAVEFQLQWYAVMLVTITEAYLQDALSYCASIDPRLMKDSEQRATYQELSSAKSLEELAEELRNRWARNFVDSGGPAVWIDRLCRMGARDYPAALAGQMEQLWGIRHVVVHRAGIVTSDFARRHSSFGLSAGDRLTLTGEQIKDYAISVHCCPVKESAASCKLMGSYDLRRPYRRNDLN